MKKKIRRILSNWVNDPKNLVNCKGEYFGDKFGARITMSAGDGYVTQDLETFCRDVKNKNNRLKGTSNNFIILERDVIKIDELNRNYSTMNNSNKIIGKNIVENRVIKVFSSSPPTDYPDDELLRYSLDKSGEDDDVIISESYLGSGIVMDKHTTRKEFIEATTKRYGHDERTSDTTYLTNWYVCKKCKTDELYSYVRLSFEKFPEIPVI